MAYSQVASFSVENEYCLSENILFTNESTGADAYLWDFCVGDLDSIPVASNQLTNSIFNQSFYQKVVLVGDDYYVFVSDFNDNRISVLKFSDSLSNETYSDFEISDPLMNGSSGLALLQYNEMWYGFLANFSSSEILRLSFGTSLENAPTIDVLTDINLVNPSGVEVVVEEDDVFLVVSNGASSESSFTIIEIGAPDSDINASQKINSAFGNRLRGISVQKIGNDYVGLIASSNNGDLVRLDFANTINSTPTISNYQGLSFSNTTNVDFVNEGGHYYATVMQRNGTLHHIKFDLNATTIASASTLGNLGVLSSNIFGYSMVRDSSNYYAVANDFSNNSFYLITYPNTCGGSGDYYSNDSNPFFSYNISGVKGISLAAFNGDQVNYAQRTLTVIAQSAPDIDFTIDENRCILINNTFTSVNTSGDISSYTWDFNGEGNSTDAAPTFDFVTTGEKTVTLNVSNASGCPNEVSRNVTIYPEPPTPTFSVSGGSLCTNNTLSFNNTTVDAAYDGLVTYSWDLNGEGNSTETNTQFTFATAGDKTITLQSFLTGCSSAVTSTDISIDEGPEVSFTFSNNCFSEAIAFTGAINGDFNSISWDFDDGTIITGELSPEHTYATAGNYTVQFTVTNDVGCSSTFSSELIVNDGALADFGFSNEVIENVSASFDGQDLTTSGDEVISWSWDFGGLGVSTEEDPSFTFTSAGDVLVTLTVETTQGCVSMVTKTVSVVQAVCPTLDVSMDSDLCLGELLTLSNNSINGQYYEWDFCGEDFRGEAEGIDLGVLTDLSTPYDLISLRGEEANTFHSFIVSRDNQKLFRIDFDSLSDTYAVVDLGDLGLSANIQGIGTYIEGTTRYGLLADQSGNVYRLIWSSLTTVPTVQNLGSTGVTDLRGIQMLEDGGNYFAILAGGGSSGQLVILDFGSSLSNTPTTTTRSISSVRFPSEIFVVNEAGLWFGLVSGTGSNLHHLSLGSDLSSGSVTTTALGIGRSAGFSLLKEFDDYYAIVNTTGSGTIYRMNFGSSLSNTSPTLEDLGNFGGLFSVNTAFEVIAYGGIYYGLGVEFTSNQFSMIRFTRSDCESSTTFSQDFAPTGEVSYGTSGTYPVILRGFGLLGCEEVLTQTVTVNSSTAPDISFTIDESRCILNENTFTSVNTSGDISTYSWDFNGEGSSSEANPTFDFTTTGEKTITLQVSNADGCTNTVTETLTIYPEPPMPTFTVSGGSLCTNTALTFTNTTDETGYDDVLTYSWDFNGEGNSTSKDGEFTFATSGTKTVTLQSFLPGCSSALSSTPVEITVGPEVSFTFDNNCFGEAISFTGEITGSSNSLTWDFGDGTTVSDELTPTHTYSLAGSYTVSLRATNADGCETIFTRELEVNDGALAAFSFPSEVVENLPISFDGEDLTLSGDAVVSWSWDFGGLESSTEEDPTFIFTDPGEVEVVLIVETSQGCSWTVTNTVTVIEAVCPTLSFTVDDDLCIGESLTLSNESVNTQYYEWDFCGEDYRGEGEGIDLGIISELSSPFGQMTLRGESANSVHTFIVSRDNQKMFRIDFDSLSDSYDVVDLGDLGHPSDFQGIGSMMEGSTRYGILTTQSGIVYRLQWSSLTTAPTAESLGDVGVSDLRGVELLEDGGNYYAVIAGDGNLVVLDFGSSFSNEPTVTTRTISGVTFATEVSVVKEGSDWFGLVSGAGSNLHHLSMGTSLTSGSVTVTGLGTGRSAGFSLLKEQEDYYALVNTTNNGSIYRLNFGSSLSNTSPTLEDLGNFGGLFSVNTAFEVIAYGGIYYGLGVDLSTNQFSMLRFTRSDCESSTTFSQDGAPTGQVSYGTSGTYPVILRGFGRLGCEEVLTQTVTVNSSTAPDISFTIDESRCILNENTFTSVNTSGDISTYSWDFNGEGSSSEANPTFDFTTTGEKTITLQVSNADGCTNTVTETLTIYPEPPMPTFTVSGGSLCTNTALTFTNTTDETGYDDVLTYSWDFNGEGNSTSKDGEFTFVTSGTKTVTLQSFLPGCSSALSSTPVEITVGPEVSFTFDNNCFGEAISFTGEITGSSNSLTWDFGDGTTVSDELTPTHTYSLAGSYTVSLRATNADGCETIFTRELEVNDGALAAFSFPSEVVENLPISFDGEDLTLSGDAVVSWSWDFGGLESSTEEDPTITFTSPGEVEVDLIVETSQGCSWTVTNTVTVIEAVCPTLSFTVDDDLCIGESLTLSNESVNTQYYEWDFCGEDYRGEGEGIDLGIISELSSPFGQMTLRGESANSVHTFIVSRDNQKMFRIDFDSLSDSYDVVDLGDLGHPSDFQGIGSMMEGSTRYGILTTQSGLVYRLQWSSLTTAPTAESLGDVGVSDLRGVELLEDGGNYYAVIAGDGNLVVLDFGSSFSNEPTVTTRTISGVTFATEVSVVKEGSDWFGLVSGAGSNLHHLSMGTSLTSGSVTVTGLGTGRSAGFSLLKEQEDYYALVNTTNNGSIYRLNFGSSLSNTSPTLEDLGNFGGLFSVNTAFEVIAYGGIYYGLGVEFTSNQFSMIRFTRSDCESSTTFSQDFAPTGEVSYGTSGTYPVILRGFGRLGCEEVLTQTVTVNSSTAPDISFTIDESRCILNENTFTSVNTSGDISTYSWDFNGEGSSSEANPTFDFTTTGEKTITLQVSNADGCTNTVTETLTIYPEPPLPTFTVSGGSLCTNTALTFTNTTDETGYDDVLTYSWDFNGEGNSTSKDGEFTFATSGTKTVTLQSFLPGCSSALSSTSVEITVGPEVSFTFNNNCFGEAISFAGEITGSSNSLTWDFGDGTTVSDELTPTHTYSLAGSYTVSLRATNADGCETIFTRELEVNDGALAAFSFPSEVVENLPISFEGEDLTLSGDAVVSWSWDFGGIESSTEEDPTITFTSPGEVEVDLIVETSQGCSLTVTNTVTVIEAVCPTLSFTVDDDLCLGESLMLSNESVNTQYYEWDFCGEDYKGEGEGIDLGIISELSSPFGQLTLRGESANSVHTFIVSRDNQKMFRIDFDSLSTSYDVVDLGDLGIPSDFQGIGSMMEGSTRYGILTTQSGIVYRLQWSSLTTAPTAESLGDVGVSDLRGVELLEDGGNYYAVIAGDGNLVVLDFGSSFSNEPTVTTRTISGVTFATEVSVVKEGSDWFGLVSGAGSNLHHLSMGTSLTSGSVTVTGLGTGRSAGFSLLKEFDDYYAIVNTTNNGSIYRLNFGSSLSNTSPTLEDLGNFGGLFSVNTAFEVIAYGGIYYGLGVEFTSNQFSMIRFTRSDCESSTTFSQDFAPTGQVSYGTSGTYPVILRGFGLLGCEEVLIQSFTVNNNTAPDIEFNITDSRCIDNANIFTASTDIYTYSWDFNGEGVGISAEETFQFTSPGEKRVTLDISDGTCTNTIEETITIYDAPPVPVFDISGNICQSTSLEIANSTEDADWEDVIAYDWTFNGDSMVTADQPDFAFTGSGDQSVSVVATIPGCTSEAVTQQITVNDLPGIDYSISPTCDQEVTNFTNLTIGAISYSWDFGDGFTSTQTSPSHLYQVPGDYEVSMVATNSSGCTDTLRQAFSVDFLPEAGFRAQLPCEGAINLIDTSSVAASDIVDWSYSVESIEELFSDQNPELILNEPGDYEITQEVTSSAGCQSSVTQIITVQDAADPAIQIDAACFGSSFHFTDISDISTGNRVISRIWNFEGQNIEIADTSIVDIDYVFSTPGTYDVSLTLTTQNLCTSTISSRVTVLERPVLAFDNPQICQNDFATFSDLSTSTEDAIVSRQWILNGALIGNGTSVSHKFTVDGDNDIWLVTTTAQGCIDTLARQVNVLSAPVASFEASSNFGVEGSGFTFTNTSTGSTSYQWLVDDQPVSTDNDFETIFDASGNREVSLIAFSEFSCSDTTSIDVLVRVPEIDIALTGMRLVTLDESPEFSVIQVSVENNSNLPVNSLRFSVEVEDQLPFQSTENVLVPIGQSRSFELNLDVPNQASYICVQVTATYDSEDMNMENNSICENFEPQPVFPPVYPNPATNEISVDTVLPTEGDVIISLLDASGKVEIQERYTDLNEGLQSFRVELAPFKPGIYFIRIAYGEFVEIKRIVKQ